jgi:hypothetical protein
MVAATALPARQQVSGAGATGGLCAAAGSPAAASLMTKMGGSERDEEAGVVAIWVVRPEKADLGGVLEGRIGEREIAVCIWRGRAGTTHERSLGEHGNGRHVAGLAAAEARRAPKTRTWPARAKRIYPALVLVDWNAEFFPRITGMQSSTQFIII